MMTEKNDDNDHQNRVMTNIYTTLNIHKILRNVLLLKSIQLSVVINSNNKRKPE